MAKSKITKVNLVTVSGRAFAVAIDHAEKILLSKNNKNGLIKLGDDNFELTTNGLRKKSVKKDNTESKK